MLKEPPKEHHFDKKTFDRHHLEFKASAGTRKCKFSERVKYDIQVKPNDFDLDWLYSVPCGEKEKNGRPCQSWIFLRIPDVIIWERRKRVGHGVLGRVGLGVGLQRRQQTLHLSEVFRGEV